MTTSNLDFTPWFAWDVTGAVRDASTLERGNTKFAGLHYYRLAISGYRYTKLFLNQALLNAIYNLGVLGCLIRISTHIQAHFQG